MLKTPDSQRVSLLQVPDTPQSHAAAAKKRLDLDDTQAKKKKKEPDYRGVLFPPLPWVCLCFCVCVCVCFVVLMLSDQKKKKPDAHPFLVFSFPLYSVGCFGNRIFVGGGGGGAKTGVPNMWTVFDWKDGKMVPLSLNSTGAIMVTNGAIHPKQQDLVAVGKENSVAIWKLQKEPEVGPSLLNDFQV